MSRRHASLLLHGAKKLDADGVADDFWILVAGDRIAETGTGESWRSLAAEISMLGGGGLEVFDAEGAWITPGFIDLHVHGGGGGSFDEGAEGIRTALAFHRAHGTTRSAISLVANPLPALAASLAVVASIAEADPLVLGAHLEGPFLAPSRRGAHDPSALIEPRPEAVAELIAAARGRLTQVTLAPELPGALDAIGAFTAAGAIVAVGHTDADLAQTRAAFDRGARLLTHAFNAMRGIHHRDPGPVMAALDDERIALELIADGVHVHPSMIELAFRSAPGRVVLVTDAMAAAGSADGAYRLGTRDVTVAEGRATLPDGTIAGSTLTQEAALRGAMAAGVGAQEAVAALTATPARVLGREHELGYLRRGHLADLVVLDEGFVVQAVFAAGARVPSAA